MFERFGISLKAFALLGLVTAAASAQNSILTCQTTVNPILVRGEGLTERMGDILFQCAGGIPGQGVNGNLSIFLSVPMTNRVNSNGDTDLNLTIDSGSGPLPARATARYLNSTTLSFSGVAFNLSPTGGVAIRISNLRGAANQAGVSSVRQITASLSFNAGSLISFSNNTFPVGTVVRSLYSSYTSRLICAPSGTPSLDTLTLSNALAVRAPFATIRVTEGFASSLAPKSDISFQSADFGSRVIVRFSGIPTGARIYVPDAVVGLDGLQPTSAGDYGMTPSGGSYAPGSGTLLLLRVVNADARGGGQSSSPVFLPPNLTSAFDSLTEITIGADGVGQAVFEVYDSNQFMVQSATIPTFLSLPFGSVRSLTEIAQDVFLGPTSSSLETTANAVIARFSPLPAPNDCVAVGDCGAFYFPRLAVNTSAVDVSLTSLDTNMSRYFVISNTGSGNFLWNANVRYLSGISAGVSWLRLSQLAGINRETVRMDFVPGVLPPGIYDAIISVDGGPIAGTQQIRVTMRLSFEAPKPILTNAVNSASMKPGTLVPGSQASIQGDRLSGNRITVFFNDSPARVLNSVSATRLDVQVPYDLAGKVSALITVNVDGSTGQGILIPIGDSAPAVFSGSLLNEDFTSNNPSNGALAGSTVQVYATGLPVAGYYSGHIHDRTIDGANLVYSGPAPTLIGVQMMRMIVPVDLPSMTTSIAVCGGHTVDGQVCSESIDITLIALPPPVAPRQ